MTYCTVDEVKNLTGTDLSDAIVESVIEQSDREIDAILRANGISGGNANDLKAASTKLSIAGVMTRHRMDGTQPSSLSIGDISTSDDINAAIAELKEQAYQMIRSIIRANRSNRTVMRVVNR